MKVRHADIKEDSFESPKGTFGAIFREYVNCEKSGCPFDLEHVVIKPGKKNFPFHTHGALWELYYVLSGTATMRTDDESTELQAGDSYLCKPGLAHQITNNSDGDFAYLVISNDPPYDACYYPDSGKLAPNWRQLWGKMSEKWRFWQPREGTEYFTGEE